MNYYFLVKKLINKLKKKTYILYLYEDEQQGKKIATYKERSMRNAILKHFLSYKRKVETLKFKPYTDYNDNAMYYILDVDKEVHLFSMLREVDGVKVEQR